MYHTIAAATAPSVDASKRNNNYLTNSLIPSVSPQNYLNNVTASEQLRSSSLPFFQKNAFKGDERLSEYNQQQMLNMRNQSIPTEQNLVFTDSHEDLHAATQAPNKQIHHRIRPQIEGFYPQQQQQESPQIYFSNSQLDHHLQFHNQQGGTPLLLDDNKRRLSSVMGSPFQETQQLQSQPHPQHSPFSQQCPSHPAYGITNICVAATCIEPLCPECVKIHTYMHNQRGSSTHIDTIECKRNQCLEYVDQLKGNLQQEQAVLERVGDVQRGDLFHACVEAIQKAKEVLMQSIEQYFCAFELRVKAKITDIQASHPHLFNNVNEKIVSALRDIDQLENDLQSPSYVKYVIQVRLFYLYFLLLLLSSIIKILSSELTMDLENVQAEVDIGVEKYMAQLFEVNINEKALDSLPYLLDSFLQITPMNSEIESLTQREQRNQNSKGQANNVHELFDSMSKTSSLASQQQQTQCLPVVEFTSNSNTQGVYKDHQGEIYQIPEDSYEDMQWSRLPEQAAMQAMPLSRMSRSNQQIKGEHLLHHHQHHQQQQQQHLKTLQQQQQRLNSENEEDIISGAISTFDYFTPECPLNIIHFFQDNSKLFHFIDLSAITKDPRSQEWQTVELNIPIKIPMFHRSIITPSGQVYLVGGIDVAQKSKPINSTFALDMASNSLQPCANMHVARSHHTLVYCADSIYAVGGMSSNDDNMYLNFCERFDLESERWIEIAGLSEGMSGVALCNFEDKFIYRFGGRSQINEFTHKIERYSVIDDYWQVIRYNISQQEVLLPSLAGACQINESEMIILGGVTDGELNQRQTFIVQVEEESDDVSVTPGKPLPAAGSFWQNPLIGGNVLFAMQNVKMETSTMNYFSRKNVFIFNSLVWKELGASASNSR